MPKHVASKGFTLIEITMVLVLLGILAAVAVPKFFDLQDDAENKAVLASAAEVQARLEATFSSKVLEGLSCTDARTFAASLANLADDSVSKFGEFVFQTTGDPSRDESLGLKYRRGSEGNWKAVAGFTLVLPQCSNSLPPGYSAVGRQVYNSFFDNSYVDGYPNQDDKFHFSVWSTNNWVTMQVTSPDFPDYRIQIGKNAYAQEVQNVKLLKSNGRGGWVEYGLKGAPSADKAASRDSDIEIFKQLCPNFDDLFYVENKGSYNAITWKQGTTSLP